MRPYFWKYLVHDEASTDGGEGGGGGGSLENFNMEAAVNAVGAGLGLGDDDDKGAKGGEADPPVGSATPPTGEPPKKETVVADPAKAGKVAAAKAHLASQKVDYTGKTDDEILKLAEPQKKAPPKAWKAEMHPHWDKVPPEVQAYLEQREAEVENGFKVKSDSENYGKSLHAIIQPYQALLDAQGVKDHGQAVRFLLNAHNKLSTGDDVGRAQFFAGLAKQYRIDVAKMTEAYNASPGAQETPEQRALRERMDKLENDRKTETQARYDALKAEADQEIAAFAADPKHPYFKEVASEVALFLQDPKITLAEAYERAVWANPVTRAKEEARLKKEAEDKAKADAEAAAKAAEKARGTRVRGEEKHRGSPDLVGSMEDTMRETYREIQSRT